MFYKKASFILLFALTVIMTTTKSVYEAVALHPEIDRKIQRVKAALEQVGAFNPGLRGLWFEIARGEIEQFIKIRADIHRIQYNHMNEDYQEIIGQPWTADQLEELILKLIENYKEHAAQWEIPLFAE